MEALQEISCYLDPSSRIDIKAVALEHVLGNNNNPIFVY